MSKRGRSSGQSSGIQHPEIVMPIVNGMPVFADDTIHHRFIDNFRGRGMVRERGVNTGESGEILQDIIDFYGLANLVSAPEDFNGTIVKEIYAFLSVYPNGSEIIMRGQKFAFGEKTINDIIMPSERPNETDEYTRARNFKDNNKMRGIATEIGFEWPESEKGALLAIKVNVMSPEWRKIHQFVVNRLLPSNHVSTTTTEYIEFIHWLSCYKNVNFGDLINQRVRKTAQSVRELGYGSILTTLALRAGVPQMTSDERIKKLPDVGEHEGGNLPFDPPPQRPRAPTMSASTIGRLEDRMDYVVRLMNGAPYAPNWRDWFEEGGSGTQHDADNN